MAQNPLNISDSVLNLPPLGDKVFSLNISRNTLIAFIISVLLHLVLLWFFAPKLFSMGAPKKEAPPFEVTLGPPQKKETAQIAPETPSQIATPEQLPTPPAKPKKRVKEKSAPPKQIKPVEVAKQSELTVPEVKKEPLKKVPPPKELPKETSQVPLPGEDMPAFIKRQKEAKLAAQGASKEDIDEVLASNNPQSAGEKRDAKIKENLKFDGSNGIFVVRELGLHSAQFSFKGWKNNINNARLEIFDVNVPNANDTLDVQQAVIRKMIEIIRRDYSGDFQWESHRLDLSLTLSARLEDNTALEEFLMIEIFGSGAR